jgi:CheY-like chemotaxis protein
VDLGLPGGDGFNVIKRIRSMYRLSRIPIAVLTGMHSEENRVKAEAAGAVAFLPKPIDSAELLRVVAEATGRPAKITQATTTPPAGSAPSGEPSS